MKTAMHYHSWHRDTLPPLNANRICLPALGHFDQVGAFIAAELLREKADANLERAFAVTEPLIELAIKRMEISETLSSASSGNCSYSTHFAGARPILKSDQSFRPGMAGDARQGTSHGKVRA